MLDPGKSSKPSRRRRSSRRSAQSNSQQPLPLRRSESPNSLSDSNYRQVRQSGTAQNQNKGHSSGLARRAERSQRSSSTGGDRFNLRSLLNNPSDNSGASSGSRREMQFRARNGEKDSRSESSLVKPRSTSSLGRPQIQPVPIVAKPMGQVRPLRPVTPPPAPAKPQRRSRRRAPTPSSPLLYATRLLILGVGIGAIAGTILSMSNPKMRSGEATATQPGQAVAAVTKPEDSFRRDSVPGNQVPVPMALRMGQPIPDLTNSVKSLIAQNEGLTAGVFAVDLDNGNYVDINSATGFSAASTIKIPILVAFLQDVDAGKIRLSEQLTMQQADVTDGSGEIQYLPVGSKFSALETAFKMITISDNTATNMLIARLGGKASLNQRFSSWGLSATVINSLLADLQGTNMTSAKDLSLLLTAVSQGDLLSLRSRDRLMEIMQGTVTNTLLPAGLDAGAVIAHKTGNIDTISADSGIVDMPNGKRYVITVIVKRTVDDGRAQELIRRISRTVYTYFNQQPAATTSVPAPAGPSSSGQTEQAQQVQ